MTITVLSLFPDIMRPYFASSIVGKAVDRGLLSYRLVDIRDFASDKHRTCDDAPYGGGPGMVMKPEPLGAALEHVGARERRTIYPTPAGVRFTRLLAREFSAEKELVFIAGRYEGIDQRIIDLYVDDEICVGDYVLSSGEVAALVIIDAVYRLLEGAISAESLVEESFEGGLLEYPQYTRPEVYQDLAVPDVLRSGHFAKIAAWRREQATAKTRRNRPDLIGKDGDFVHNRDNEVE